MARNLVLAFAAVTALATGAMAQNANPPMADQPGMEGAPMGGAEMSDAISTNPDRAFAAVVISHARLQRQISDLVAEKATNPQIKKLAQDQADDYQKFSQRAQEAAKKEGITLHQDRMLPRDQAVLNFIKQLPVSSLERNYVFHQAGNNQTHLLMCQWAAKNAQKPEIKQLAQEIASKLQQRSETIQQLAQAEISGGGRTASEEK